VIGRLLAKRPEDRYADTASVLTEFTEATFFRNFPDAFRLVGHRLFSLAIAPCLLDFPSPFSYAIAESFAGYCRLETAEKLASLEGLRERKWGIFLKISAFCKACLVCMWKQPE
jgi:hypothetical protein